MAASLQAQWDAVYGPNKFDALPQNKATDDAIKFQQRVAMAMVARAWAVGAEGSGVIQHTLRMQLATKILNAPLTYMAAFAHALASQQIDQNTDDANILGMVANAWNAFAGVP